MEDTLHRNTYDFSQICLDIPSTNIIFILAGSLGNVGAYFNHCLIFCLDKHFLETHEEYGRDPRMLETFTTTNRSHYINFIYMFSYLNIIIISFTFRNGFAQTRNVQNRSLFP